ncbi:MAG: O-antigen ligase family protein [Candidatus Methanomethyliaceae archaeon]
MNVLWPRLFLLLVLLWILLLPVQLETTRALGFRVAPGDAVLAAMAVLLIVAKGPITLLRALRKRPAVALATALAIWFCLTLPVAAHALGSIPRYALVNKIIGLGGLILILATFSILVNSMEHVDWATRWYVRFGSVWNALGLLAWVAYAVSKIHTPFVFGLGRLSGLLIDPNAYGGFLVTVFLLQLMAVNSTREPWGKRVRVWNSLLLLAGIFLTISRSAAIALCAGSLFAWFECRGKNKRMFRFLLLAALVTVGLIWTQPLWHLQRNAAEITEELVEASVRIQNLSWRLSMMVSALKAFARSPLWGIGLGVFPSLEDSQGLIIHNTFLWLLAETGIVSLLIFGLFLMAIWLAYRKARKLGGDMAAGLAATVTAWLGLMIGD